MITPEQLKKVAEYMGYKTPDISGSDVILNCEWKANGERVTYNPLQNSDQDAEVEIKFSMTTSRVSDSLWQATIYEEYRVIPAVNGRGDTPKEARLNAAIAYVEGLDNE